jgi:hypothetical protein
MKVTFDTNIPQVQQALEQAASQVPFALSVAINNTLTLAQLTIQGQMPSVFDRPTPWVVNSLRLKRSTKTILSAELAFKDKNSAENSRSMIEPNVFGGTRHFKAMEARLMNMGYLPAGWNVVPGGGASLDAYGNMSRGQISQLLNVLGTFTEAGYNKANAKTVARLAKGNVKKNVYGFVYWVNPANGTGRNKKLPPGVYQRVKTGFGSSLKPILIFVKRAQYRQRLDFNAIVQRTIGAEFEGAFTRSFAAAMGTALLKVQGDLL